MIPRHPETRRLLAWMLPLLALATVLRLVGIGYGLPFPLVSDEEVLIGGALRMAETGEVIPSLGTEVARILYYPVLLPWLYLVLAVPVLGTAWVFDGFPGGAGLEWTVFESLGAVFLVARLSSLAFSVATVALVALIARRLFGTRIAGIAAGLLMATSWFSVALGHVARHWSATVFFIWLAAWLAVRYHNRASPRRAFLIGLASGLGFGTSYIGAVGLGAGLAVHLLRYRRRLLNRNLAWMLGPVVLSVVVFSAVHWGAVTRLIGIDDPILPTDQSKSLADFLSMAGYYATVVWWAEPVLLAGGLIGLLLILRRHAGLAGLLLLGALGWLAVLYLMMPWEDRYIMPALPILAIAAGGGAATLADRLPVSLLKPALVAGVLVLLYPLATSGWFSLLMASTDTRVQAAAWLEENLADGAAVVIDLDPVTVPATLDGLLDQELYAPGRLDARMRLARDSGWPGDIEDRLRAVHVNRVTGEAIAGDAGRALFETLRAAGYGIFAIALREDGTPPTGLQRAVLDDYRERVLFLTAASDSNAPPAPDLRTTILVDGPVWRLFALDRLGRSVVIGEVGAP